LQCFTINLTSFEGLKFQITNNKYQINHNDPNSKAQKEMDLPMARIGHAGPDPASRILSTYWMPACTGMTIELITGLLLKCHKHI